jgi:hypothetical protein
MKRWKALSKSGTRLYVPAKTRTEARKRLGTLLGCAVINLMLDTSEVPLP